MYYELLPKQIRVCASCASMISKAHKKICSITWVRFFRLWLYETKVQDSRLWILCLYSKFKGLPPTRFRNSKPFISRTHLNFVPGLSHHSWNMSACIIMSNHSVSMSQEQSKEFLSNCTIASIITPKWTYDGLNRYGRNFPHHITRPRSKTKFKKKKKKNTTIGCLSSFICLSQ